MGKEPDQIRQDIEDTRARMGETVEAIGYKADVPARARESVTDTKDQVVRSVTGVKDRVVGSIVGTKESVGGSMSNAGSSITESVGSASQTVADSGRSVAAKVADMTPSSQDLRQGVQRSAGLAQENPLGLAFGSIKLGFIAGLMVPATRVERQNIGPVADQIVDKATRDRPGSGRSGQAGGTGGGPDRPPGRGRDPEHRARSSATRGRRPAGQSAGARARLRLQRTGEGLGAERLERRRRAGR